MRCAECEYFKRSVCDQDLSPKEHHIYDRVNCPFYKSVWKRFSK